MDETSLQWDMYTHREHNLELVLLMLDSLHAQAGRVAHNTENSGNCFFYLCLFYLVLVLTAFLDFDVGILKQLVCRMAEMLLIYIYP